MNNKVPELEGLIGCEIKTHYRSGGVVTGYRGPWGKTNERVMPGVPAWSESDPNHVVRDVYTITYEHSSGSACLINSITIVGGVVMCEGKPLQVLGRVRPHQISLF